ncbi:MAG: nucleotidyltransferase family protein [Candidatus Electrothrix sp. GW3-4]|uniref:nucleotidyltransferase domain-containing protein n=1 Tax=Candidatus Electrothrix sp. GW3-4 TaxID=3126740 RepID=UPI0030CBBC2A
MTVRGLQAETGDLLRQVFLDQDLNWPENGTLSEEVFFRHVVSQGMAPLLFRRLAGRAGSAWPQSLVQRLRESALHQSAFDLVAEMDLCHLLDALAEIDVKPLLLKGTPLSYTLYPEPGLRPRCDTDLLIRESDRDKTAALMKKMGYAPLHEAQVDSINTQMSYAGKTAQGITCRYDIHWQVSNCNRQFSRDFTSGKLFAQAEAIPALGEHACTLSKVDALIFACFHRAGHFSHSGDRLIWLYDIHLLCQALTAHEVARFYQLAKELQMISLCVNAMLTAQSWFGTVCSEELQTFLQETGENEASSLLLGKDRNDGIRRMTLLELQGMATWQERFSYIVQNLFPPPEFMLWRYQKKKIFLPWLYARRLVEGLLIILRR